MELSTYPALKTGGVPLTVLRVPWGFLFIPLDTQGHPPSALRAE